MLCVPDALLDPTLPHAAIVLYLHIARHLSEGTGASFSREAMAACVGLGVRAVDILLGELDERGLIGRDSAGAITLPTLPLTMTVVTTLQASAPAEKKPAEKKPAEPKKVTGTPRRRPAGVEKGAWEEHCTTRIAEILTLLPAAPELAAWRAHVAPTRTAVRRVPGDLADLEVLLALHEEKLDWRKGLRRALEKQATSIRYAEAVARNAQHEGQRPTALPPRSAPTLDPEEEEIKKRTRQIASASYRTQGGRS